MSCEIAISINDLHKSYKILRSAKTQLIDLFSGELFQKSERKNVLRHINLQIAKGQRVGILGVNGAGKSTLLNIIAGMSKPTSGTVRVNGKIGAILELGAGFHHDMTGRQNVAMQLLLQGCKRADIPDLLAQVESFSELGAAFDQRIKTYSSGMLVRLAFAAACAVVPDIFIVDEALAVGDARFQQKCYDFLLNRMAGGTLVLISHDMSAISAVCDRVVILNEGNVAFDGCPGDGIVAYHQITQGSGMVALDDALGFNRKKSGPCEIDIVNAEFLVDGHPSRNLCGGESVTIRIHLLNPGPPSPIVTGFNVLDLRGQKICGQTSSAFGLPPLITGHSEVELKLVWPKLAPGAYTITVGVGRGLVESLQVIQCWINNCFEITQTSHEVTHGLINLSLSSAKLTNHGANIEKNNE